MDSEGTADVVLMWRQQQQQQQEQQQQQQEQQQQQQQQTIAVIRTWYVCWMPGIIVSVTEVVLIVRSNTTLENDTHLEQMICMICSYIMI